jgi:hypothetical protein
MKQFKTADVTTLGFTEVTYSQVRDGNPIEKYIDLYSIEHLIQFTDLLKEAGYRHQTSEEYKSPFAELDTSSRRRPTVSYD